jgi:F0F1-type ATP synthase membrane subunit b/b'
MEQTISLSIIALAAVVMAVVAVLKLLILARMGKSAAAVQIRIQDFLAKAEPVLADAKAAIGESRQHWAQLSAKANEVLDLSRKQLSSIDNVLSEATARAMVQMERAELVLDDAMGRVQETIALVHSGFLKPIREVNGLITGFHAGIMQLLRGGRTTPERATHDDEMFI